MTELTMNTAPTTMKTTPSACEKRVLVLTFSMVMMAPSTAIQSTFITPTANINPIIAQQQCLLSPESGGAEHGPAQHFEGRHAAHSGKRQREIDPPGRDQHGNAG